MLGVAGTSAGLEPELQVSVLVVEGDDRIAEVVEENLRAAGFATSRAASGPAALEVLTRSEFTLIILDVGLPGIDGYELTRRVRQRRDTPILMITPRTSEAERVLGLELGADDSMSKPFSPQEMVARVRAILRRTHPHAAEPGLVRGNLRIDFARREVWRSGQLVPTTNLEFELLTFFVRHAGRVYSRDALMREVWGHDRIVDVRSVDSVISRLRRKLEEEPAQPRYLVTVWGAGYRFDDGLH
jgi:DNA-binding response OmpR family regulator